MSTVTDPEMIGVSLFQFRNAMKRQARNKPSKVCQSCGQPICESLTDCCHPQNAVSDADRAKELLERGIQ